MNISLEGIKFLSIFISWTYKSQHLKHNIFLFALTSESRSGHQLQTSSLRSFELEKAESDEDFYYVVGRQPTISTSLLENTKEASILSLLSFVSFAFNPALRKRHASFLNPELTLRTVPTAFMKNNYFHPWCSGGVWLRMAKSRVEANTTMKRWKLSCHVNAPSWKRKKRVGYKSHFMEHQEYQQRSFRLTPCWTKSRGWDSFFRL